MNRVLKYIGITLAAGALITGGALLYLYMNRDQMIMDGPGMVYDVRQMELVGIWDNPAELSSDQLIFTYDTVTEKREGIKLKETMYRFEDEIGGGYKISPPAFKEFLFADYYILNRSDDGFVLEGHRTESTNTQEQIYLKKPEDGR